MYTDLDFQLFKREDYQAYYSWFQDPDLNRQLGPMEKENDEWLEYIFKEGADEGCTYSVFSGKKLVSVVGITYPDEENQAYCITSIAVKPSLRNGGLGKSILRGIMYLHSLKKGQYWKAYVDIENPRAKQFFENNGWECTSLPPANNNMFLLEYRTQ